MKFVIVSDIHGSLSALEQVVSLEKSWDLLISLGDHLYHGPRNPIPTGYDPKGVAELLNSLENVVLVKGNVDAPIDEELIRWPMSPVVHVYAFGLHWLGHHGHVQTVSDLYRAQVTMTGHTHVKKLEMGTQGVLLNPGSVSLPKDGQPSYGRVEDGVLELKDLAGKTLNFIDLTTLGLP
ncbi:phosphodiesterase [Coprothermobacteraceae bacterium]|nr:phosphodiesterase [Coprothermobacteraceae bacterium]